MDINNCPFISARKSKFECYYSGCPYAGAGCKTFDSLVDFDYLTTKGAANGKNEKEKDDGQKGRAEKENGDRKKGGTEKENADAEKGRRAV